MEFTVHTIESAPSEAKEALAHAQETFGFIPNLEGIMAQAPALLKGSLTLWNLFSTTSFSPVEREIVYLTVNYENSCQYCMAAHTGLAKMVGMSAEDIQALRKGIPLQNPQLQALRHFTERMVQARGWVEEEEIKVFRRAGYSQQQVLEVILGIAIKIIHNYTNHIAETPLDKQFQTYTWSKPTTTVEV